VSDTLGRRTWYEANLTRVSDTSFSLTNLKGVRHLIQSYEFEGCQTPHSASGTGVQMTVIAVSAESAESICRCRCLTPSGDTLGMKRISPGCQTPGAEAATREASSPRRKTPRKSPKAARAAERGRASQDASSSKSPPQKRQAHRHPRRPKNFNCSSPVRWQPGVRGASISPRESEGSRRRTKMTTGGAA